MDHGRSSANDDAPATNSLAVNSSAANSPAANSPAGAVSASDLLRRLDALERRTGELERQVVEKDEIIAAQRMQIEALATALDRAREQLALLKKALFSPRRERYAPSPD